MEKVRKLLAITSRNTDAWNAALAEVKEWEARLADTEEFIARQSLANADLISRAEAAEAERDRLREAHG